MIYSYIVKKRNLTDVETRCLRGGHEVICSHSLRELQQFYCADFQFPNGDTFPLKTSTVYLTSAIVLQ